MRVLVADDDPVNLRVVQGFLSNWGYEVIVARDGYQAWTTLMQENPPTLAILDWVMPGMDGPEICRELRKQSDGSYTYIILLTASLQKADLITGLDAGADDYLTKPFNANELGARLRTGKRILELQEQLRSVNDQLKFQTTHDPLTGVASRSAILETLRTELARARRDGTTVSVLMADLDHFKKVNDTHGHLTGDAVLESTAKRMRSSVRPYDSIGRYGGEEFLIIMPRCDLASSLNRAEELRIAVESERMITSEEMIQVTVSVGVTVGGGTAAPEIEQLLRAADSALYKAKNGGRNRVAVAEVNEGAGTLIASLEAACSEPMSVAGVSGFSTTPIF